MILFLKKERISMKFVKIFLILICLLVSSNAFVEKDGTRHYYYLHYKLKIIKVYRNGEPVKVTNNIYQDKYITASIKFNNTTMALLLKIKNRTPSTMKIIWDDATLVTPDNRSHKVMHNGVRFIDRFKHIPPTPIAPLSEYTDKIVPVDNVEFFDGGRYIQSEWFIEPMLKNNACSSETELKDGRDCRKELKEIESNIGKVFKLGIPLKTRNKIIEYLFILKVVGYNKEKR